MRLFKQFPLVFMLLMPLSSNAVRATDVLTYRYGPTSEGVNYYEPILNLNNVNPVDFGLKYSIPIQGQIYAQPLVKTAFGNPSKAWVFVATQHNVVAAINVATGVTLWSNSLTDFGNSGTPVPNGDVGSTDIQPEIGICSTPVMYGTYLYVMSKAKYTDTNSIPHYGYTIYIINITNGKVLLKNNFTDTAFDGSNYTFRTYGTQTDPYVIGTGDGSISVNGTNRVYFNALREMNRCALSLVGGVIYAGFASHGDNGPYHGWVLGFDYATLKIVALLNTTPNGGMGGIWESGGRIASDAQNNLYLETGNGSFDGTQLDGKGFPIDGNYGDCFLKLARDASTPAKPNVNGWGLRVADYFTPTNNDSINKADLDLGACGPVVVPSIGKTFIIGTGKDGSIYSMNSTNMGKFNPDTNKCFQTINNALCIQGDTNNVWTAFCTPSYFYNRLYAVGAGDYAKQFTFTNGFIGSWYLDSTNSQVQTDVESVNAFSWPGANTTISANGTNDVILWAINQSASVLRAFRASDLLEIWNSSQVASDNLVGAIKFSVPVVANGHVFVGADGFIDIFGVVPEQRH